MGKREVSISICGVVTGVIIGAGALAYTNGATLSAELISANYRDVTNMVLPNRRNLQNTVPLQDRSKATTIKENVAEPTVEAEETAPTTCETVRAIIAEIQAAHEKNIPANFSNTERRSNLKGVLNSIVVRYCKDEAKAGAAASASSTSAAATIDNDCTRYGRGSMRYTDCKLNEKLGKLYRGY